jgi:hypothetical protein
VVLLVDEGPMLPMIMTGAFFFVRSAASKDGVCTVPLDFFFVIFVFLGVLLAKMVLVPLEPEEAPARLVFAISEVQIK